MITILAENAFEAYKKIREIMFSDTSIKFPMLSSEEFRKLGTVLKARGFVEKPGNVFYAPPGKVLECTGNRT